MFRTTAIELLRLPLSKGQIIEIAMKVNLQDAWDVAINAGDFSIRELIEIGNLANHYTDWNNIFKKIGLESMSSEKIQEIVKLTIDKEENNYICEMLIQTNKIPVQQMFNWYYKHRKSQDLTAAIIKTNKLSNRQMFEIGEDWYNVPSIWKLIIKRLDLNQTLEEMLKIGQQANNEYLWPLVADKISSALKKLSARRLLEIGRICKNFYIWKVIFETKKLTIKQMIEIAKKNESPLLWKTTIETKRLTIKQLVELYRRFKNIFYIQSIIADKLTEKKLTIKQLLIILKINNSDFTIINKLIETINSKKISIKRVFEISKKIDRADYYAFWTRIDGEISFNNLSYNKTVELGKEVNHYSFWILMIKNKTLTTNQLLKIMETNTKIDIWEAAIEKKQLTKEELIKLAERIDSESRLVYFWNAAFKSGLFTKNEMIRIGLEFDVKFLWDTIIKQLKNQELK